MILWFVLLLVGLAVLVKSSDWFTHAAERLGLHVGISPIVVGVTIVSIGTSLPELASSIVAVTAGASEIVIGNALGSNVANVLMVLALGAVIGGGLRFDAGRHVDWPFLVGSSVAIIAMLADRTITLGESLLLLVGYALYLFLLLRHKSTRAEPKAADHPGMLVAVLMLGGLLVYLGSRLTVESVIRIAELSGVSEGAIAASVIAFGTSVPELAVTVVAAYKGRRDIAFGNILGSSIFNVLVVIGTAGLFGTVAVVTDLLAITVVGLVVATALLLLASLRGRLSRLEGVAMLILYAAFILLLF